MRPNWNIEYFINFAIKFYQHTLKYVKQKIDYMYKTKHPSLLKAINYFGS